MIHWLKTAFEVYVLHFEKGNGYQFWSGIAGSFIMATGIWSGIALHLHRANCHQPRCPRLVRHGKTLCRKHEREVASA